MAIYRFKTVSGVLQWVKVTEVVIVPPTGTGLKTSTTLTTSATRTTKG